MKTNINLKNINLIKIKKHQLLKVLQSFAETNGKFYVKHMKTLKPCCKDFGNVAILTQSLTIHNQII